MDQEAIKRSPIPRYVWNLLKVLISLGLLAWLALSSDWRGTLDAIRAVPWSISGLGFFLMLTAQMLSARRLQILLMGQDIHLSYVYSLRLTLLGLFVGNFLPSTVGGDAVKVVALVRQGHGKAVSTASVVIDRFVSLVSVLCLLPSIFLTSELFELLTLTPFRVVAAGFFVGAGMLVAVLHVVRRYGLEQAGVKRSESALRSTILEVTERLYSIFARWATQPGTLLKALALSWLAVLSSVLAAWFVARGLRTDLSYVEMLAAVVSVYFLALLPISFNGLGVQEIGIVYLLSRLGVSSEQALALAVLIRLYYVGTSLLGLFDVLTWQQPRRPVSPTHTKDYLQEGNHTSHSINIGEQ